MSEKGEDFDGVEEGFAILCLFLIIIPASISYGWGFWCLYGWFGEPLTGVPIGFWHSVGLMALWGYLRMSNRKSEKEPALAVLARALTFYGLMVPLAVLAGLIIHKLGG